MMATKEEKRELLHRKWEEQIAECESSNMPVKEWCAVNGGYHSVVTFSQEVK